MVANTIPLGGLLFLGWDVSALLVVYWSENIVIGFYTVLKMALARGGGTFGDGGPRPQSALEGKGARRSTMEVWGRAFDAFGSRLPVKILAIPFFIVHYMGFTIGHALFVVFLTAYGKKLDHVDMTNPGTMLLSLLPQGFIWPVLSLVISHGISFYENYIQGQEYRTASVLRLTIAPYGRVLIMQTAVMAGALLVMASGSAVALLGVLVGMKTIVDIIMHRRSHAKLRKGQGPEGA